jgi:hypothetical protein
VLQCGRVSRWWWGRVSGDASAEPGVFTLSSVTLDPIDWAAPADLTLEFMADVPVARGDVVSLVLPGAARGTAPATLGRKA